MSSIETLGLGAGSYPEEENEIEEFEFYIDLSVLSKVKVYAKTKEEAEEYIQELSTYDLLENVKEINIEDYRRA